MKLKLFRNDFEASIDELNWILKNSQLQLWSQFDAIIDNYKQEPEIMMKKQPLDALRKAFELLESLDQPEVCERIENIKDEISSIYDFVKDLTEIEVEEDFYSAQIDDEVVEALDDFIEEEIQIERQEIYVEEMEIDEPKNPFKCQNCLITLQTFHGFHAHQKTCSTPKKIIEKIESVCDSCGKSFKSMKGLKEHMKLHDSSMRKKCPHCDLVIFGGSLQRHVSAVHNKMKPHCW
jgi:hypothetical protein